MAAEPDRPLGVTRDGGTPADLAGGRHALAGTSETNGATVAGLDWEPAPAKVNLFLHLRGQRPDGYHLLESLAVFPALGDRLEVEPATGLSLSLGGPFGDILPADGDNLVLRAAEALARAAGHPGTAALRLEKNLPVASGIGGGSSDAAAALRLLARFWGVSVPDGVALRLGADVPVCLCADRPTFMAGIGEQLAPSPALPPVWIVLVNPLQAVETRAVFAATMQKDNPAGPPPPDREFGDFEALAWWLDQQRNDLEPAARGLCPAIAEALTALGRARIARMSGSGATCFALHGTAAAADAQADEIRKAYPAWWVAAAPVAPGMSSRQQHP